MKTLSTEEITEAKQYHLKATFIRNKLQANLTVYGSNSVFSGANTADVNLALQYINRSLEIDPENPTYLNLKALLLWEGLGDKQNALVLLERALALKPRDIDIQNNLKNLKKWQPARLTVVGYLGILIGAFIVFAGLSELKGDGSENLFAITVGFFFIYVSFRGARR